MATSPDRVVAGLVGGRYEITGLIASGGMGSVYRARDTVLDRIVAVKVLKTGADDPDFASRFRTEATNAARLSHPNIVQVYDFGADDDRPYMAMEYIDGQSLREVIATRGPLRPEAAARIAAQVAAALEHARRAGIVHRDVKPENILITTDGQVKMADFGLSRALAESRATQAEVLMGTAHYLAPEQVQGGSADHRADVYALGIVLYEMLTGRPPFSGDTPVVIAYQRVAEDVPSTMTRNPDVPSELDVVVARATARDPDERYGTAGEMATDLRASVPRFDTGELSVLVQHTEAIPINGQATVAVPKRSEKRTRRRRRSRRWALILLILSLLAATGYVGTNSLATVEVPGVAGESQEAAKRALTEAGFQVDTSVQNHPSIPVGHVIAQDPAEGTFLRRGTVVSLVISVGPELVSVPSVVGRPFRQAERLLDGQGLKIVRQDVFHDDVPRLEVISQSPDPNVLVEPGSTITLQVSRGVELIRVPDVVGDPVASASADLQDVGFLVAADERHHGEVPAGRVISQTPRGGTELRKGETVRLVVSKGPAPVKVPNVLCMTDGQARDALIAAGFTVRSEGSGSRVVDQDPVPGENAPRGSRVTIYLGSGAVC